MGKIKCIKIKGNRVILHTHYKGETIYQSFSPANEETKKLAEEYLIKRQSEINDWIYRPNKISKTIKIKQILDLYWLENLCLKKYSKDAKFLLTPIGKYFAETLWMDLRYKDIDSYIRFRLSQKTRQIKEIIENQKMRKSPSPRTIEAEIDQLSMALNHCKRNKYIDSNPIEKWKQEISSQEIRNHRPQKAKIDSAQWQKFYNEAYNQDIKDRMEFEYETGMRINEVCHLHETWTDEIQGIIIVPAEYCKTKMPRTVILGERAIQLLRSRTKINGYYFANKRTGKPYVNPYKGIANAAKRAGLGDNVRSHALRRTRAQLLRDRAFMMGINPEAGNELLGHSERVSRENYTHVSIDDKIKLVRNASIFENKNLQVVNE